MSFGDRSGRSHGPRASRSPRCRHRLAEVEPLEGRQLLSASPHVAPYHALALFHLNRPAAGATAAGLRSAPASVVTDRADYLPGDSAVITGSGFRPGERVRLHVLHTDGTPNTAAEHRPWRLRADGQGGFTTTYPVGEDDLHTSLRVTAVGLASGRVARHRFTDGQKSSTTTTVASSANPSVYGQSVTLTATVSGARTPTGTVTFLDGGTTIGTGSVNASGQATLTTSSLAVRSHTFTARYAGDSRNAASTSAALTQTVSRAATSTTVALTGSSGGGTGGSSAPVLRPDHVVIVIEEDRAANAIGDPNMPYFNQLASSGLLYSNSHGVNPSSQEGEQDYLALYSGSTQGVTDNGRGYSFAGPNLSKSLYSAGLSFAGYAESLPVDGSQVQQAGDSVHPDIYVRNYNPMAMFTDAGPGVTNAAVNRTYNAFKSFSSLSTQYATLPTVSFVVPNTLDSTHGSNEAPPYATDPSQYNFLRSSADTWLRQNLDGYLQWAKTHNSLLIVTGDEGDRAHDFSKGVTTIVNGDPRLFVPGADATTINHFNVLRTIEDMYGLAPLGSTAAAAGLNTNGQGQLADLQSSSSTPPPQSQPPGTSVVGQPVTFTARVAPVAPGAGSPTGTVQFRVDGTNYGSPVALSGGVATSPPMGALGAGSHTITAAYNSDVNFTASTAPGVTQTVTQANTTLGLSASTASAVYGQPVTLTATVAVTSPGGGTPAGVVTFTDGSATLGTATLNASGVATLTTSSLAVGSHSVAATYAGNANYAGSASAARAIAVARGATAASLTSSANPATAGQAVTFTARIAAAAPGAGTPTGTVQFRIDGADFGGPVALAEGSATSPPTSTLAGGNHTVTAVYSGDANFTASTAPALTQTVNSTQTTIATTISLATSASPAVFGQPVTLTVTVAASAGGTPTGTVTFTDGATTLGAVSVDSTGHAALTTSALSVGSHAIAAAYSGDGSFAGSTSAGLAQSVNRAATTTAIASSANPAAAGQAVSFTATIGVVSPGTGAPSGTVQFVIDGANFGSPVLLGPGGAATSASTTTLTAGSHTVTAVYSGDANFTGSTSAGLTQTVASPTTTNNDNFANRTVISGTSATLTGFNSGATKEAGEPNHAGNAGGKSVWWTWTAPSGGTVTIDTSGSNFDTLLAVYTGASVSALTAVPGGSNDDSPAGGTATSKVTFAVTAGTAYQIAVDGYGGVAGSITLHLNLAATVTSNDNFANRTALSGTSITATASNSAATKETGEPNHAGNVGGKSVWWTWTAPASGTVTIDTLGSSFDTLLAVYTGSSVSALAAIAGGSNDDSPAGGTTTSKVTFAVTAGTTYQIAVDGYGGVAGSITLHLNLV